MSKKYLKNENGLVRAVTTEVLELEKPLVNEFYDINVFNRNMDKIENALKNVSSSAEGTSFDNSDNGMSATNVQDAIEENKQNIEANKTSIQSANRNISSLESSVSALQSELGTNKSTLEANINSIREVL